jgi:hypothetical protein
MDSQRPGYDGEAVASWCRANLYRSPTTAAFAEVEMNVRRQLGEPALTKVWHNRRRFSIGVLSCLLVVVLCDIAPSQERDFNAYPENVTKYLKRIYDQQQQPLAYREDYTGGFSKWQEDARKALRQKIGLPKIAASVGDHQPVVELDDPQDLGDYLRQRGVIETEPDVRIPFWLLKPKGRGPWPLGVFPHGHDRVGYNTTAGVYSDDAHKQKSLAEDRDVAVQAVKLGFVSIAPAVRGMSTDGVPDFHDRHGKRDCRSQAMHCLLAGRTATGERVGLHLPL